MYVGVVRPPLLVAAPEAPLVLWRGHETADPVPVADGIAADGKESLPYLGVGECTRAD